MSRNDNIARNTIFNGSRFIVQIILQFILKTIMIYTLGKEYLGLNGLFTNVFGLLSLAELGISTAIVFV